MENLTNFLQSRFWYLNLYNLKTCNLKRFSRTISRKKKGRLGKRENPGNTKMQGGFLDGVSDSETGET